MISKYEPVGHFYKFLQNQQLPWEHYDHRRGASGYEAGFSLGERL